MDQSQKKTAVAKAALSYVRPDSVLGVGTGSTVNCFIDALARSGTRLAGAVSSSDASTARLTEAGIAVIDLNAAPPLDLYVDGADEADDGLCLIKGGGGALTREKIVAAASQRFVCIVDDSKLVDCLGAFPLPVEVIPMARTLVERELARLGGTPRWREGFTTDNGNVIVDVAGLRIDNPRQLETEINQLAGVVTVGLFAHRGADALLVATNDGVVTRERSARSD